MMNGFINIDFEGSNRLFLKANAEEHIIEFRGQYEGEEFYFELHKALVPVFFGKINQIVRILDETKSP